MTRDTRGDQGAPDPWDASSAPGASPWVRAIGFFLAMAASLAAVLTYFGLDFGSDRQSKPAEPVVVALPQPTVRVTYFKLSDAAPDLLVNGFLTGKWAEAIGRAPPIANNSVLKTAKQVLQRFRFEQEGDLFQQEGSTLKLDSVEHVDTFISALAPEQRKRFKNYKAGVYMGGLRGSLALHDANAFRQYLLTEHMPSGYRYRFIQPAHLDSSFAWPQIWRSLTADDLDNYDKHHRDLASQFAQSDEEGGPTESFSRSAAIQAGIPPYKSEERLVGALKWLTRNGVPEQFMIVKGVLGAHGGISLHASVRSLTIEVAVIENISTFPITMTDLTYRSWGDDTLRSSRVTDEKLSVTPLRTEPISGGVATLKSGEKFVIPLRVSFTSQPEDGDEGAQLPGYVNQGSEGALVQLPVALSSDESGEPVFVGKLQEELTSPTLPRLDAAFDYGPALSLHSVAVGKHMVPLRQPDWERVVLVWGVAVGSCPFVFSRESAEDAWISEGIVLANAHGAKRVKTEIVSLHRFDGSIRISELEDERATIEAIEVLVDDASGKQVPLQPAHAMVRPVVLDKGETVVVRFPQFSKARHTSPRLRIRGYYERYSDLLVTSVLSEGKRLRRE